MTKPFYYDYFALRDIDPEEWSDNFFWTVPRETTTQITTDFYRQLAIMTNNAGFSFKGDCALIAYQVPFIIIPLVNHMLSVTRILNLGYNISYSDNLQIIPILLNQQRDDIFFHHEEFFTDSNASSLKSSIKNMMIKYRNIKYNLRKGSFNFYDHFRSDKYVMAFNASNVIDRTYTTSLKQWVKFTSNSDWLRNASPPQLTSIQKNDLVELAEEYLEFTKTYMRDNFDLDFDQNIWNAISDYLHRYMLSIGKLYTFLRSKTAISSPKHLLTPTGSKTFTRALSLAVQNNGGTVTGFPHGYYIGHHSGYRRSLHEFATVNSFMAYTPGSVELLRRNTKLNPLPRQHNVEFPHENTPFFKNTFKHFENKKMPDKINTVMILELSLISEWAGYYAAEAMVNYHFYYNLCKTLSKAGYKVLFKRRPKNVSWENFNIFRDIPNVEIVYGSFESTEIIDMADAVIIQYGMSSTLFWAMCTNKTVIYANAGWESWYPDVYELMAKRCRILKCSYDERNRTCFDKQELLGLLGTPPKEPDTEFIEKYLFPE